MQHALRKPTIHQNRLAGSEGLDTTEAEAELDSSLDHFNNERDKTLATRRHYEPCAAQLSAYNPKYYL